MAKVNKSWISKAVKSGKNVVKTAQKYRATATGAAIVGGKKALDYFKDDIDDAHQVASAAIKSKKDGAIQSALDAFGVKKDAATLRLESRLSEVKAQIDGYNGGTVSAEKASESVGKVLSAMQSSGASEADIKKVEDYRDRLVSRAENAGSLPPIDQLSAVSAEAAELARVRAARLQRQGEAAQAQSVEEKQKADEYEAAKRQKAEDLKVAEIAKQEEAKAEGRIFSKLKTKSLRLAYLRRQSTQRLLEIRTNILEGEERTRYPLKDINVILSLRGKLPGSN